MKPPESRRSGIKGNLIPVKVDKASTVGKVNLVKVSLGRVDGASLVPNASPQAVSRNRVVREDNVPDKAQAKAMMQISTTKTSVNARVPRTDSPI